MMGGGRVKHSYGLTLGLHFRQPHYTRGQSLLQWLASFCYGAYVHPEALSSLGGHEKRSAWARVTFVGLSLQVTLSQELSNWSPRRRARDG